MKRNTILKLVITFITLVLLLSSLTYAMHSTMKDTFDWNAINPIEFLTGWLFALGFGFGIPLWGSLIITFAILGLLGWGIFTLLKIFFK